MTEKTSLQQKLEQYSTTTKGQTIHSLSAAEIAGYAAAAAAALTMAGAADASIIYSGVQNISVAIDPTVQATAATIYNVNSAAPIDMDGGGTDFLLSVGFAGRIDGPSTAKYIGAGYLQAKNGAAFLGSPGGFEVGGVNLAGGATVGPGGVFSAYGAGRLRVVSMGTTSTGNFASGVTGFVGIKLGSGNFGWIRLRLDNLGPNQPFTTQLTGGGFPPIGSGQGFPDKVTVIDWAYDDSGAPIHVADPTSQVPEPSSLFLLAGGAAGIAAFRRRKAERRV